jgi:multidrug resistance efflux pump
MVKWATFLLAGAGVVLAVYAAATARVEPPPLPLASAASINPFPSGIAASGAIEAASRNVPVSAPEGGLCVSVRAQVGDRVKAGDPLFSIDTRPLQAELVKAEAARDAMSARLSRQRAMPRPEEIPPLEAAVQASRAELLDWQDQEKRLREVGSGAMSERDLARVLNNLGIVRAKILQAEANLSLMKAGAWNEDVRIAEADVANAEAAVRSLKTLIERGTVRAPIDATVLKRNIEPGQYATIDPRQPAMVLGDVSTLNVRAQIDEEDLPMLREGAKGIARVRGRAEILVPLRMVRIEPLAEAKLQLLGTTTERVDTRVLEVIFRVEPEAGKPAPPLYPGQFVDVFIEASEPTGSH